MTSHYETLGVARDATPEQIKAARRRRASEAHPDKGGSDDEMQRVNRAYEVLIDPERRAGYDRTGTDGDRLHTPVEEQARQLLRQLIDHAIEADRNVVDLVRRQVAEANGNLAGVIGQANVRIRKLEKRRPRIRTNASVENIAHQLIDAKVAAARQQIADAERLRLVNKHLVALIDAYAEDEEPTESRVFNPFEQPGHWPKWPP